MLGKTTPRIFTPPLITGPAGPCGCGCALTPATSYGFAVDDFATEVLAAPLDPWERWAVIHGGELLPDGRPRFRKLLLVVGRQNGKTHLLVVLSLFWLFIDRIPLVLGTSTKLDYARESWQKACRHAKNIPALARDLPPTRNRGIRQANGEQELALQQEPGEDEPPRYKIAPANEEGGRSLTIGRAILDELRQHHDYSAWDAIVPATNAVADAQVIAISNMGDDRAVVLNDLIDEAEHFIETGEGDERFGAFLWVNEPGADPRDLQALAQSNPNLGHRIDPASLLADAESAVRKGGDKLAGFMTEIVCARVKRLNPAIDPKQWEACLAPNTLDHARGRLAACVDVAPDGQHATLAVAAVDGSRVRVEVAAAWDGADCVKDLRRDLPGLVARIRPRALGWFPSGPAAELAAAMTTPRRATTSQPAWPPPGVVLEPISTETSAVCMGFAEQVRSTNVMQSDDPLLNAHVTTAEKLKTGDRWVFSRRGGGHCDAAYAAAGAVHLSRTLPEPVGAPRIVRARRSS